MSGRALIESGSIQFADINWQTGNNQNWEDISTVKQNLVIAEDGKLIGVFQYSPCSGMIRGNSLNLAMILKNMVNQQLLKVLINQRLETFSWNFELMFCAE